MYPRLTWKSKVGLRFAALFVPTLAVLRGQTVADRCAADQAGTTPLIEAVKNGHIEVVRVLLEKGPFFGRYDSMFPRSPICDFSFPYSGADPTNSSAQGPPEQHTSDSAILEVLSAARNKMTNVNVPVEHGYPHDPSGDVAKGYYPPPGPYYYPMPPPMMPEGVAYYPPPPPPPHHMGDHSGMPNLPPPEIARMIPCRYYPACRYGASCMFLHPQTPYLQGPLPPPAQYPAPYDPMNSAPYPPYYPLPPPPFQSSPNGAPMPTVSPTLATSVPSPAPPAPMTHSRNGSELVSPAQPGYAPVGVSPPVPYGVVPPPYAHAAPISIPMQPHSPMAVPHSPQQPIYPVASPGGMIPGPSQYPIQPSMVGHPYPPQGLPSGHHHDPSTSPKSPLQHAQPDGYAPGHKETYGHYRRGSARRPSFGIGSRKPPCLFFPSGRCKNGYVIMMVIVETRAHCYFHRDDCRFPHVLEGPLPPPAPFAVRNGHRPRGPSLHANGMTGLEDKFSTLTTQDV
jgi:hypothetical protein